MRSLLPRKLLVALLMFAVVLSCSGFETAFAATADKTEDPAVYTGNVGEDQKNDADEVTPAEEETKEEETKEEGPAVEETVKDDEGSADPADEEKGEDEEAVKDDEGSADPADEEKGKDEEAVKDDKEPSAPAEEKADEAAEEKEEDSTLPADDVKDDKKKDAAEELTADPAVEAEDSLQIVDLTSDEADIDADGNTSSLKIKEIKKLPVSKRIISAPDKGTLEEALAKLPKTWNVTFEDGTKGDVKVSWKCVDDFDDSSFASFVFAGKIDDPSVAPVDDELVSDLKMEIQFRDAAETKGGFFFARMSVNTLSTQLDAEQGTEGATPAFSRAYGSGDEISTGVSYGASNTVLSETAYETFKGMSPIPDNYFYKKLSTTEKNFYNGINNAVADYLYYGKKITTGADGEPLTESISARNLDRNQMDKVFYYYYYDNPQAFFLTTWTQISGTDYDYSMRIALYPTTSTPRRLKARAERIAKNIRTLSKKVNKVSNDHDRLKEAQKLICKRLTVDTQSNPTKDWKEWTEGSTMYEKSILSAFYGSARKSIDGAYAKSFTAVARLAGFDAFVINSEIQTVRSREDYEWNKVRLYGEWFCADPCADDTDDLTGDGCTFEKFLKSDKTINKDNLHKWADKWKNFAPVSARDYSTKIKKYKIKYHLNGGTNSIYNPSNYTFGATTIKLHDPVKKGRKFGGWYKDDDFDTHSRIYSISPSKKKDYSLYAKWILKKYKIRYKLDNGKNNKENPKYYYATSKTRTLKKATKKGYVFKGWYTDKAMKNRIKKIKGSACQDYTLYAKWKPKHYKLNFKVTKDVDNSANKKYYTIKTKSFKLKDPVRPGYDFEGWYTDSDLTNKITRINTKTLKAYTLYPKWKVRKFKITYKLNGGKNSSGNPKEYNINSSKITLKEPTKKGYKFAGWYTDAEFTKRIRYIRAKDVCDYTLYAKWVKK